METIDWEIEYPGVAFYDIQKQIITEDKEQSGIFLGTGVGKTLTCLVLAKGRTLIICPKQQMLDRTWEKNNEKFELGRELSVINYDMFWRKWEDYGQFDTVILDEGHRALGVLPETHQRNKIQIPKTSNTFEAIYLYLKAHRPERFYICTATPMAKPMNVWALAKLFGKDWDFFKFRQTFYFPTMMGRRQVWLPRKDDATRMRLADNVKRFGYTGALTDFMDVPEQTHLDVEIELTDEQQKALDLLSQSEADPLIRRSRMRTIENGLLYRQEVEQLSEKEYKMSKTAVHFKNNKIPYILERADEFPKLFVFAAYTAQIHAIAAALTDAGHEVRTVTGATKNRATIFEEVEKMERGVIVIQAGICEGYRVPSAACMIFASKSNRFVHFEQGKGRILDGQHLKKNLYIHLVVKDGTDEACHQAILSGVDFQEKLSIV